MFQIRKGWPSHAAIDEVVTAATGYELTEGIVATIDADHTAYPAEDITAGTCGFVFGMEPLAKTYVALLSDAVIDIDADHYVAGDYSVGDYLTVGSGDDAGKFASGGSSDSSIGRVLNVDSTTGVLRVRWFASH